MNKSLMSWLGQVTTGHGFMILGSTVLSVLSGTMPMTMAAPLAAAGVIGLLWPENTALQSAVQTVATDVATAIASSKSKPAA